MNCKDCYNNVKERNGFNFD